jgi:acyl-coenzyme A thioesterase PaaI-like protein
MSEGDIEKARSYPALPCPRDVPPPPGFRSHDLHDPFEALFGPYFERFEADGARVTAFIVDDRHVNADGFAHDGALMSFADAKLGGAASRGAEGKPCVTMSLQASFLADVKCGDTVVCRTKIEKRTRSVMFVSAAFTVDDEPVMNATSLWKVLGAR